LLGGIDEPFDRNTGDRSRSPYSLASGWWSRIRRWLASVSFSALRSVASMRSLLTALSQPASATAPAPAANAVSQRRRAWNGVIAPLLNLTFGFISRLRRSRSRTCR
jgi:hypothetical protein